MNILITGMTASLCNIKSRTQFPHCTNSDPLYDIMTKQGHNISWHPVVPGEDVSKEKYDVVFVNIIELTSINARHSPGCIYTMNERPDAIVVIEDCRKNFSTYQRQYTQKSKKEFFTRNKGYFHKDKIWKEPHWKDYIIKACDKLGGNKWPHTILFPSIIRDGISPGDFPTDNLLRYDSSSHWMKQYSETVVDFSNKKRIWILSALSEMNKVNTWFDRQNPSWDKMLIGDKKQGIGRIQENELVQHHANSWGLYMNHYPNKGNGYIRYKYVIATKFGCIPYGHKDELNVIGPTWGWCADNLETIESMNDAQLRDLHSVIKQEYIDGMWSEEQLNDFVNDLLENHDG